MSQQQPQTQHNWDAFHSGSFSRHVDDMHHQDRQDYSMQCNHEYSTWSGNPMINICRCGEWHFKK